MLKVSPDLCEAHGSDFERTIASDMAVKQQQRVDSDKTSQTTQAVILSNISSLYARPLFQPKL
jgi:hypothetical protein